MSDKPLKIVSIKINNILRLKAVEITPHTNVVTLTGKNEQGKSSVLNCIAMAFGGADFVPERPIRDGANSGDIEVDLDDLIAELKFTASGKTIVLRAKEGGKISKPQSVLDSLWNKMCDPMRFIRLSDTVEGRRKQGEILRQLVGLDFTQLEAQKKKLYDERTLVNRDLQNAHGQLAGAPFYKDAPQAETSVAELMKELTEAREHNGDIDDKQAAIEMKKRDIASQESSISKFDDEIKELERQLQFKKSERTKYLDALGTMRASLEASEDQFSKLQRKDTTELEKQITNADNINAAVRANVKHKGLKENAAALNKKIESLTAEIAKLDQSKLDQLSSAKFPLPGLSFDESGVSLDGKPFSQGSQAEQLRAAIAIGLALNPRLRVIIVRDASLFDADSMRLVAEMAEANQAQIWQEVVDSKDESAIVIEDGEVK